MELWIGPAIVAALVSAFVSAAGWFVSSWQAQRLDERRRAEKVHDYQVALRAEIASDLLGLQVGDRGEMLAGVASAMAQNGYKPFVPHLAKNLVFEQVVREIHILPGNVIAAIISYSGLRQSVEYFVTDIRGATNENVPSERVLLMMSDYFDMLDRLEALAANAVSALDASLKVNRPDEVPPNQGSASELALAEPKASADERKASP